MKWNRFKSIAYLNFPFLSVEINENEEKEIGNVKKNTEKNT